MSENQDLWKKYHIENDKPYMFDSIVNDIVKKFDINSILEVGCGLGNNLEKFKNFEVMGIDISEFAIGVAKKRYPDFQFSVKSILDMPIEKQFDLVFSCAVIEHIKPEFLETAFDKMFKISKKYILNIEAYDETEHEINWHRGKNEFWTVKMKERWSKYQVEILEDRDFDKEYRITLVSKCS